jgi:hypothetical protein
MEYQILYVGMILWVRNAVFRFLLFCQESVENFNDLNLLFFGQNLCSQPFVDMLCIQKCIAPFYAWGKIVCAHFMFVLLQYSKQFSCVFLRLCIASCFAEMGLNLCMICYGMNVGQHVLLRDLKTHFWLSQSQRKQ